MNLLTLKLTPKFVIPKIFGCVLFAKLLSNIFIQSNIANSIIIPDISVNSFGNNSYLHYEPYFNHFNHFNELLGNFDYSDQRLKSVLFRKKFFEE